MTRAAAALLAASLVLLGCQGPVPVEPEARVLASDDPRPAAFVEGLRARARSIEGMRGRAKFSLDSPELEFRRPQRVAALRTRALRVETIGLFGQLAAVLVTRDGHYQFYDASTHEVEEGVVSRALLWQLVRVDLDHGEVVDLLLGGAAPPASRVLGRSVELADGVVRVGLEEGGRPVEWLDFDAQGRLRRVERMPGGDSFLAWQATFDDYRPDALGSGLSVAHEVAVRIPAQETQARFRFSSVELNPALSPSIFVLKAARD